MRVIKNKGGFTLLEVIISIAALSFISIFILQMFMVSANINNRAKDSDIAMSKLITQIEELKSCDSFEDYNSEYFDGESLAAFGYDENWNPLSTDAPRYLLEINVLNAEQPHYSQEILINTGTLYTIDAVVTDTLTGFKLAAIQTKKYFPKG